MIHFVSRRVVERSSKHKSGCAFTNPEKVEINKNYAARIRRRRRMRRKRAPVT